MPIGEDFKRMPIHCEENNPHACDHCGKFLAIPGSKYCPIHAATSENDLAKAGLYDVAKNIAMQKLDHLKNHSEANSLTNELAILRVLLEQVINSCEGPFDFLMKEATISKLVLSIQTTLVANQKVEERLGELLSTEQVIAIIQKFFEIIAEFITDPNILEQIANRTNALLCTK